MRKLILDNKAKEAIQKDLADNYPAESCGFLYGFDTDDERTILEAEPILAGKGLERDKLTDITTVDYSKAESYAEAKGMSLLGVYLSSPDHSAVPSTYHLRNALPFYSYLIVPVRRGTAGDPLSWKLTNGKFIEEEIQYATAAPDISELFMGLKFN